LLILVHAVAPPVGLVDVSRSPVFATAAHRDVDGHDTLSRLLPGSIVTPFQAPTALGSVEVSTDPWEPTPTHSVADGHESPPSSAG
jgi:hypothetical protein